MMDWSTASIIVFFALLAGHILFDLRSLVRNLRQTSEHNTTNPALCDTCHAHVRGKSELRHEALWAAAAVIVLSVHIILDFIG